MDHHSQLIVLHQELTVTSCRTFVIQPLGLLFLCWMSEQSTRHVFVRLSGQQQRERERDQYASFDYLEVSYFYLARQSV